MDEINQMIADGNKVQAKQKFKELVEKEDNPNIERKYIKFLYEQAQYHDFRLSVSDYLRRNPEDGEIKELQFDFYAKLASDAERVGNYEDALDYIVAKLLDEDYKDFRKWEGKQASIFKKWYNEAKEKGDKATMKDAVLKMYNMELKNLAQSLDPELFDEVTRMLEQPEEAKAPAAEEQ
ncbi:MAG: hypothetical protein QNK37_09100 [Acidobacteriota bacterium]|nr:hypothetical protein [Acidobacteriota bacterium]